MAGVWRDDGRCLVCGPQNASGLALHFHADQQGARAQGEVPDHLQGFAGTAHGGIVAAILDEAMYYAVAGRGMTAVATGELKVRYRLPLPTGRTFAVEARCTRLGRRFARTEGSIRAEGELIATAEGIFLPVPMREEGDS